MEREDYLTKLYPLQDAVLAAFSAAETDFYLTGGTAASRGYLDHRFSDDLDLFVNDDSRFGLWADREEPRDLADVWGFCVRMSLSLAEALEGAHGKAAGLFPVALARPLLSATESDWNLVRWNEAPPVQQFVEDLHRPGEELLPLEP